VKRPSNSRKVGGDTLVQGDVAGSTRRNFEGGNDKEQSRMLASKRDDRKLRYSHSASANFENNREYFEWQFTLLGGLLKGVE